MFKVLWFANFAIFLLVQKIQASSEDIKNKFRSEEIIPDVLDDLPEVMNSLKVTYASGVNVTLGNVLKPSQVSAEPKVEWNADVGAVYTLLMTGISEVVKFLFH